MLLGVRQECVADSTDIGATIAILKRFGYDFLELSLSREEIAGLQPQSARMYQSAIEQTGPVVQRRA